jgi:predicted flap endonuclease-1-like 5' DNA nuclease
MQTTEDVLTRVQTPDARSTLSYSTGIPEARLLEIARICEFLQIRGVGPKVAHLLVATGVANVSDLATRDPLILLDELQQVNAVEVHTNVQPELRHVQEWIEGAQSATQLVTY